MPKPKTPRPKNQVEDEAQSQRFLDAAKDAGTTDGGLSPTDAERAFERLMGKAAPPKPRHPTSGG